MASMIRVSEAAALALHTMVFLAARPDQLISNREIAGKIKASEAHLSKVLQRLARCGFVKSVPGPRGGFTMTKKGGDVTLLDVYEAIEGPLDAEPCLFQSPACGGKGCIMGDALNVATHEMREYMKKRKLSQLAHTIAKNNPVLRA